MSAANLSQLAPVSPILSGAAIGAAQSVAGLVFPKLPIQQVVPTAHRGTIFVEASSGYMGSPQVVSTALGADYPRRALGAPTTVLYACEEYKIASDVIPTKLSQRSQFPTDLTEREAGAIGRKLALDMESRTADLFFSTANWPDAALAAVPGAGSQCNLSLSGRGSVANGHLRSKAAFGRLPRKAVSDGDGAHAIQQQRQHAGLALEV